LPGFDEIKGATRTNTARMILSNAFDVDTVAEADLDIDTMEM
jgi:hypothetical protein